MDAARSKTEGSCIRMGTARFLKVHYGEENLYREEKLPGMA